MALFILGIAVATLSLFSLPGTMPERIGRAMIGVVVSGLILLNVLPMFAWLVPNDYSESPRSTCRTNLSNISIALEMYAQVHGCMPPAYIADENGRPIHSWRVLILPYLEYRDLYAAYDFKEPWNGSHNRQLAKYMPDVYHCLGAGPSKGTSTSYLAVTGENTVWPGPRGTTWPEIADEKSKTMAVVEVADSGINWMEPTDLPFEALKNGINSTKGVSISSPHIRGADQEGGAHIACCGSFASWLPDSTPVETLEALATKAGGEMITGDY
jgi:hypothetical protein